LIALGLAACGGGPHLSNLRCRDAARCTDVEDPFKLLLAVDFQDATGRMSAGTLQLRLYGQTQHTLSLADLFEQQGLAADATRGTLQVDDDLLLDRAGQGQTLEVALFAVNGVGQDSNELAQDFTLHLGSAP
jgi:hypothetical protein